MVNDVNASPRLIRYYITLPEPLAIPDGYVWHEEHGHAPVKGETQEFTNLIFMQSEGMSRQRGSLAATLESLKRVTGGATSTNAGGGKPLRGQYTTVVATTFGCRSIPAKSPSPSPQDIPTQNDPLNRCIEEIAKFVRSYSAALEVPCKVPTYETIGPIIAFENGEFAPAEGASGESGFKVSKWESGGTLMLDHHNFSDFPAGRELGPEHAGRVSHYRGMLNQDNPLFLWKERYVEARGALYREGKYGAAVTLSNTASEVLLDALLGLLYWESGKRPGEVASIFTEGRLARRVKTNFSELLGGNWSLDGTGPVADWFHQCYRLRHRVVHGGYNPSRLEAEMALKSTVALSEFCWDRLVEKRKKFPRIVVMTIAEEGLRKRGRWCRFMREFTRDVAPVEPSWLNASHAWRVEMHNTLLADE